MKKSLFGYNKQDVDEKILAYERLIELQKRDIDYLKRYNLQLENMLNKELD